jgi:hypothetical protein
MVLSLLLRKGILLLPLKKACILLPEFAESVGVWALQVSGHVIVHRFLSGKSTPETSLLDRWHSLFGGLECLRLYFH